jgi:hypothetical protein
MKRDLTNRLERLERKADPDRVVVSVWASDAADDTYVVEQRTGERITRAEFEKRPGRFTFEIDSARDLEAGDLDLLPARH